MFYEGITKKVYVNKFERNPLARRMCIEHYGAHCGICGFDFHNTYGELGKDFIHVHHIVPISEIRSEYLTRKVNSLFYAKSQFMRTLGGIKEKLPIKNDEESSFVDKRFEISNLEFIRDMVDIIDTLREFS